MNLLFETINKEEEEKQKLASQNAPIELPEAYQVLKAVKNHAGEIREEIVDTFIPDRAKGIDPIEKAKAKAKSMKRVFPNQTFYAVGIYKRIIGTY